MRNQDLRIIYDEVSTYGKENSLKRLRVCDDSESRNEKKMKF